MYTDSHCHLNFPELVGDMPAILNAMRQARVNRALCISTTLEEFDQVHRIALEHEHIWASVGVHPDNKGVQEPILDDLLQRGRLPKVVAIGETGLDYYRLGDHTVADMEWQRQRFVTHIEAGRVLDMPLVIHTRSASDDTLRLLREHGGFADTTDTLPVSRGVFHCFTETREVARVALDLGFYISFSGIITFKTAQDLRDVVRFVPLDRMLIETDSPYLAPVPYRGKTNNPSYVPFVAQQIAELRGLNCETVGVLTGDNFDRLFSSVVRYG